MTTDFENELRDLFREKAGEAPLATPSLPASAPRQVLRRPPPPGGDGPRLRGRRRRAHRRLGRRPHSHPRRGEDRVGSDDYEVFQRTATIEAFTLGKPLGLVLGQRVAHVDGGRRSEAARERGPPAVVVPEIRIGSARTLPATRRCHRSPFRTVSRCSAFEHRPRADRERVPAGAPPTRPSSTSRTGPRADDRQRWCRAPAVPTRRVGSAACDRGRPCGRGSYAFFFTVNGYRCSPGSASEP